MIRIGDEFTAWNNEKITIIEKGEKCGYWMVQYEDGETVELDRMSINYGNFARVYLNKYVGV